MVQSLSFPGTVNGLYSSAYDTAAAQIGAQPNFEDYLMNALNQKDKKASTGSSALFDLLSNSGSASLLNGLNAAAGTNEFAAMLIQQMQQPNTDSFSLTGATQQNFSLTDSYANGLMHHFEAQMLQQMNAAKTKLQTSYEGYVERAGENPAAAAKLRIEQMQQNMAQLEQFIDKRSAASHSGSTQSSLMEQLNANAALTQSYFKL